MKICRYDAGHITKRADTPIYGKNPSKNLLFWNRQATKLGMQHRGLMSIIICSNDDTEVTLTYFMARSNFVI